MSEACFIDEKKIILIALKRAISQIELSHQIDINDGTVSEASQMRQVEYH